MTAEEAVQLADGSHVCAFLFMPAIFAVKIPILLELRTFLELREFRTLNFKLYLI